MEKGDKIGKRITRKLLYVLMGILILQVFSSRSSAMGKKSSWGKKSEAEGKINYSKTAVDLKIAMRVLWDEHVLWTRNYIISSLANLPDESKVAERLLKNQNDIRAAIKPYYGEEAGRKLADLLKAHIMIATEVVKAAKMGNNEELYKASKKWTENADEIADFLSGANTNWPKKDLEGMLHKHLEYTTQEVVSRLKNDWAADIEAYDNGHAHMLMLADALTDGIIKQFPAKF